MSVDLHPVGGSGGGALALPRHGARLQDHPSMPSLPCTLGSNVVGTGFAQYGLNVWVEALGADLVLICTKLAVSGCRHMPTRRRSRRPPREGFDFSPRHDGIVCRASRRRRRTASLPAATRLPRERNVSYQPTGARRLGGMNDHVSGLAGRHVGEKTGRPGPWICFWLTTCLMPNVGGMMADYWIIE